MSTASPRSEPFPRRDGFDPASVPVEFGGGVVLYLPPPRFVLRRRRDERGRSVAEAARSFGPEYDALVDRVSAVSEQAGRPGSPVPWDELAAALFDLAEDLIGRNYEVDQDRLDRLLRIEPAAFIEASGSGELPEPWASVWRVAIGLGPKPSGVGSSPPASSPESTPTDSKGTSSRRSPPCPKPCDESRPETSGSTSTASPPRRRRGKASPRSEG